MSFLARLLAGVNEGLRNNRVKSDKSIYRIRHA